MKKTYLTILLFAYTLTFQAQNLDQYKTLSDSLYLNDKTYQEGNKYQKDLLIFMDVLTGTHPYYIKPERRQELMDQKDKFLKACAGCADDGQFTQILYDVLGKLHDKHTDVIDMASYQKMLSGKSGQTAEENEPGTRQSDEGGIMSPKDDLFHYLIIPDESICYLQFNQCADARTTGDSSLPRFDEMLEKMFSEISEKNIQTLVVDAQYNGGGNSALCEELLIHLMPYAEMKDFSTMMRFSDLLGLYNPRIALAKKAWDADGHQDELYPMPVQKVTEGFHQPETFKGQVVFVQGPRTYSSAGMLMTLARDNHVGTIIGTTSTYAPSHYGEVLPFILPNTGELGSVSCKFFARPDLELVDDETLEPDVHLDLDSKQAAWEFILGRYGKGKGDGQGQTTRRP